MSYYDDDRPRRRKSTRDRSPDDNVRESTYRPSRDSRDAGRDNNSLVRRADSVSSADEDIRRDFPPGGGGGGYYRETTVRKKSRRPIGDDDYDDYSRVDSRRSGDYGASKKSNKTSYDDREDRRSDRRSRRYSSDSSGSRSPSPKPKKERRKSMIEETIGALGFGGLAASVLGKKDGSRDRSRDRDGRGRSASRARSRSRAGGRDKSTGRMQIAQALKAAALAGAVEAFRAHKEPGGWGGDKGKRVLTAAVGAAGVDGLISNNRNPDKHSKRDVIGSAMAGLAANRVVNGARSKSRGRDGGSDDGRGRHRSQSRGGLGDLAAGGVLLGAGKKAYDRWRSRSRGRGSRDRDSSYDSYGSRSPPRNKRRSQSVSGYAARGLAAVGLTDAANKIDPERRARGDRKHGDDYYDDRSGYNGPPGSGYPPNGGYGNQDRDFRRRERT